jgi:hypothetical protein
MFRFHASNSRQNTAAPFISKGHIEMGHLGQTGVARSRTELSVPLALLRNQFVAQTIREAAKAMSKRASK